MQHVVRFGLKGVITMIFVMYVYLCYDHVAQKCCVILFDFLLGHFESRHSAKFRAATQIRSKKCEITFEDECLLNELQQANR
jgi:hypothetical protein